MKRLETENKKIRTTYQYPDSEIKVRGYKRSRRRIMIIGGWDREDEIR